jgi:hypothetical protein
MCLLHMGAGLVIGAAMLICRYMFGWQFFVRCHGQLLMDHVTAHMALSRNGVHAHMAPFNVSFRLPQMQWVIRTSYADVPGLAAGFRAMAQACAA